MFCYRSRLTLMPMVQLMLKVSLAPSLLLHRQHSLQSRWCG